MEDPMAMQRRRPDDFLPNVPPEVLGVGGPQDIPYDQTAPQQEMPPGPGAGMPMPDEQPPGGPQMLATMGAGIQPPPPVDDPTAMQFPGTTDSLSDEELQMMDPVQGQVDQMQGMLDGGDPQQQAMVQMQLALAAKRRMAGLA